MKIHIPWHTILWIIYHCHSFLRCPDLGKRNRKENCHQTKQFKFLVILLAESRFWVNSRTCKTSDMAIEWGKMLDIVIEWVKDEEASLAIGGDNPLAILTLFIPFKWFVAQYLWSVLRVWNPEALAAYQSEQSWWGLARFCEASSCIIIILILWVSYVSLCNRFTCCRIRFPGIRQMCLGSCSSTSST